MCDRHTDRQALPVLTRRSQGFVRPARGASARPDGGQSTKDRAPSETDSGAWAAFSLCRFPFAQQGDDSVKREGVPAAPADPSPTKEDAA